MSPGPAIAPVGCCRAFRYGPGEQVPLIDSAKAEDKAKPAARPGDFMLTHAPGTISRLIRFGEALKFCRKDDKVFAHWSHAAIFADDKGHIIEALGGGVQKRHISVYDKTEYVVVHLPDSTASLDRQQAVEFAEFCLRDPYGWITIAGIFLSLLTGARFSFQIDGQQICSELVARCLERIGEIFPEDEPWHLMPADLAKHFNVRLMGKRGVVPPADEGRTAFSLPGKKLRYGVPGMSKLRPPQNTP